MRVQVSPPHSADTAFDKKAVRTRQQDAARIGAAIVRVVQCRLWLALSGHFPQRVSRTERAVASPKTVVAIPTKAKSVQAGAPAEASHQPPRPTSTSRSGPASTGPTTFVAPCDEK